MAEPDPLSGTTATEYDYAEQLARHLPAGLAWPRQEGSNFRGLLLGLAGELARIHGRALDLKREIDPRTATELLPDWEEFLGLPDDCTPTPGDVTARRAQVLAVLLEKGGQTPAYLVNLSASYGFEVEIVEHLPFLAGSSTAGDPLENPGDPFLAGDNTAGERLGFVTAWGFCFDVISDLYTFHEFTAGSSAGLPLRSWGNDLLECIVRRAKPAHTEARFLYAILEAIGWGAAPASTVPANLDAVFVGAGARHSLAILGDGSIVSWGSNTFGETDPQDFGSLGAVHVTGGDSSSGAILSDGSVRLWGFLPGTLSTVPAPPPDALFVKLALGGNHALALASDGSVTAWGSNSQGQLNLPALAPGTTWTDISAGDDWSLAVRSDGVLVAFGDNSDGQATVPVLAPGLKYLACSASSAIVSANDHHSLALVDDGTVRAFGSNNTGQSTAPAPPLGLAFVGVAAGGTFSLARLSDGSVVSWGDGGGGLAAPTLVAGETYVSLSAGHYHALAMRRTLA